jgi:Protein of unknown function (DUF433)
MDIHRLERAQSPSLRRFDPRANRCKLAAGETIEQLLQAHPRLTRKAVLAAIDFGAQALRADVLNGD